jgi:putative FmdB family regulatory protein
VPTYDYQCRSCGDVTEVIHAMTDDGPSVCERCGGSLRRVLYPAGIIFKGSGFYRTDSRASSGSADGGASTPGKASTASTPKSSSSDTGGSTSSATESGTASGGESAA